VHVREPDYTYTTPPFMPFPPIVSAGELERYHLGELKKLCTKYVGTADASRCYARVGRAFDEICKPRAKQAPG